MSLQNLREMFKTHKNVLNLLLYNGQMVRTDIAAALNITRSAITHRTISLSDAGLIYDVGDMNDIGPGRRSQILDINADASYAVGIHRAGSEIEIGLVDFKGRIRGLKRYEAPQTKVDNPEILVRSMVEHTDQLIAESNISVDRLLGLGIASPAHCDTAMGVEHCTVMCDGKIKIVDMPIVKEMRKHLNYPVELCTNAWAMALGERMYGSKLKNYIFIYVYQGVGIALVLEGFVHRGQGTAGTLGHVKVATDGPLCTCGDRGCLESFVGRSTLLSQVNRYIDTDDLYFAAEIANQGNIDITNIYMECGRYIAKAILPIIGVLEPEAVILAGPLAGVPKVIDAVEKYLNENSWTGRTRGVSVKSSKLGRNAGVIGAASLVYNSLLE